MLHWASLVTLAVIPLTLLVGWRRGWSMVQSLAVAMVLPFVLSVASTGRLDLVVAGSPVVQELAWRGDYLRPVAWGHTYTLFSAMFLHADAIHIVANLVVFLFMGLGLEERVGRGRFLLIFFVGGIIGTLVHTLTGLRPPGSLIPMVGASGAVFAVIGAYATLYPHDRVPVFFFIILPSVPVYIAAMLYAALELIAIGAVGAVGLGAGGGVARLAHLGGIVGGVLVALSMTRSLDRSGDGAASKAKSAELAARDDSSLEALIRTDQQRELFARFQENKDEPELREAWLDRLVAALDCPTCGKDLSRGKGDRLRCVNGHRFSL